MFTVLLQLLFLLYLQSLVVLPSVQDLQQTYRLFHQDVFDSAGTLRLDAWAHWDHQAELCGAAILEEGFLHVIILFWVLRVAADVTQVVNLTIYLWRCPGASGAADMVKVKGEDIYGDVLGVRIVA